MGTDLDCAFIGGTVRECAVVTGFPRSSPLSRCGKTSCDACKGVKGHRRIKLFLCND